MELNIIKLSFSSEPFHKNTIIKSFISFFIFVIYNSSIVTKKHNNNNSNNKFSIQYNSIQFKYGQMKIILIIIIYSL
jgi:hypothetical protein